MPKHLLACSCGQNVTVENSQAGEQVSCQCGKKLNVPTLRKLRELPVVEDQPRQPTSSAWSPRKGVLSAAFIGAITTAAIGGYFYWTFPELPEFDPQVHDSNVDQLLESITPAQAWHFWQDNYDLLGLVGFAPYQPPNSEAVIAQQQQHRIYYKTAFGIAAVCLLVGVILAATGKSTRRP